MAKKLSPGVKQRGGGGRGRGRKTRAKRQRSNQLNRHHNAKRG